jgi:hypothetical protein
VDSTAYTSAESSPLTPSAIEGVTASRWRCCWWRSRHPTTAKAPSDPKRRAVRSKCPSRWPKSIARSCELAGRSSSSVNSAAEAVLSPSKSRRVRHPARPVEQVSGRSRKSKNFTLPGNPGSAPPPLPMSPAQARRVGELWLFNCFTATLWLHWRSRIDPVGTATMVVAVGGPAISKKEAAEMFEDDGDDAEDDGCEPTIAMLLAATRWVVSLDLPRSQSDLWSRPAFSDSPRPHAAPPSPTAPHQP